jgi:hypothetical protein
MSLKALLIPQLNQPGKREHVPTFAPGDAIPRVIHQIGMRPAFQDRQLPPRLQENVDHLRALNPGWDYRFHDDAAIEAFIRQHYGPAVWRLYGRIDTRYGAARADLFRYLLMYKVGGVYLDIKSSAALPFDAVIRPDDRFILSQWHTEDGQYAYWGEQHDVRNVKGGEYQQWHIMCAPGHPLMKAVVEGVLSNIEAYDPYLHETGKPGVLRLTGPSAYTLAIERSRARHPHRLVPGHDRLGLEYNIYSAAPQSHVQVFGSHYSQQTAPIVRLGLIKRPLSQGYRLAQYLQQKLHRRAAKAAR